MSDAEDIEALARAAIEQDAKATPGPYVIEPLARKYYRTEVRCGDDMHLTACGSQDDEGHAPSSRELERYKTTLDDPELWELFCDSHHESQLTLDTVSWICAARTREPALAREVIAVRALLLEAFNLNADFDGWATWKQKTAKHLFGWTPPAPESTS